MPPLSDDPDQRTALPPVDPADPVPPEAQRQPTDTPNDVGNLTADAIEVAGQVLGAAAEAGGSMAEAVGSLAEGAGTVAGTAAEGCSGCSCDLVRTRVSTAPLTGARRLLLCRLPNRRQRPVSDCRDPIDRIPGQVLADRLQVDRVKSGKFHVHVCVFVQIQP